MKYAIYAYKTQEDHENGNGSEYDTQADTLKEAKAKARYLTSEEFRKSGEMSAPFQYVMVMKEDGECVFDLNTK